MDLKKSSEILMAALTLILIIGPIAVQASLVIRGPVGEVQDSTTYSVGQNQSSGDFSGFYYDIDDNIGTEILTMNIVGDRLEDSSIQYRTESEEKNFEFNEWGQYKVIGFMGEEYFAGYSPIGYLAEISDDPSLLDDGILLDILRDDSDEEIISTSNPLVLDQGYELRVKDVDVDGNRAYLELYKNGNFLDEKVITPSLENAAIAEKTYYFSRSFGDHAESGNEIAIIAVHFKNAFRSSREDAASIDGVFQLSDQPLRIQTNDRYINMTVTDVDQDGIGLENSDRQITLNRNKDIPLMADIYIRTSDQEADDQDPLRFYIYRKITKPGTYEVRGEVAEAIDGQTFNWNARNFPGFFYDLDDDLGQEEIVINTSYSNGSNIVDPGELVYRSSAQEKTFERDLWGNYYSMGFLGENYFAGYVEDYENPARKSLLWYSSEEKNPMVSEKLFKILMDSDDELTLLANSSVLGLKEGYDLTIKKVDIGGRKINVGLSKDGESLDEKVITLDEDNGTYLFENRFGSRESSKIISIAVHFKNAYHGTEADIATIDGIWQISDHPLNVSWGIDFGKLTLDRLDAREGEMALEMSNEDEIRLRDGKKINIMNDFYIETADQDDVNQSEPLRFCILREMNLVNQSERTEYQDAEVIIVSVAEENGGPSEGQLPLT
jgi:S-layer protein (TIGR01567 family)